MIVSRDFMGQFSIFSFFGFLRPFLGQKKQKPYFTPKKGRKNPKNQKIKNRPIKSLDTTILQVCGQPQKMILSQVIQILVIFHKSPL